jgi:hypothetical protein
VKRRGFYLKIKLLSFFDFNGKSLGTLNAEPIFKIGRVFEVEWEKKVA